MQSSAGKIYLLGLVVHVAQTKPQPAGQTPQVLAAGSMASSSARVCGVIPPKSFYSSRHLFPRLPTGWISLLEKALGFRGEKKCLVAARSE